MTTAFLLMTLTYPAGFNTLPVTTLTAPLVCGAWGDKMGKKGEPTPFGRLMGLFRRKQSADFPTATRDWVPPVSAPAPVPAFPGPAAMPYDGYQAVPVNAGAPSYQTQYYSAPAN